MNVKPISEFLFKTNIILTLDNNKYTLFLDKKINLDDELLVILNSYKEYDDRKKNIAILFLKYLADTETYENYKSCITDDIDNINEKIIEHLMQKLDECKYLKLLSKYILKKNSISAKELDSLLAK